MIGGATIKMKLKHVLLESQSFLFRKTTPSAHNNTTNNDDNNEDGEERGLLLVLLCHLDMPIFSGCCAVVLSRYSYVYNSNNCPEEEDEEWPATTTTTIWAQQAAV